MTRVFLTTAGVLALSNVFMTFAWYAHLRNLSERKWWIAALAPTDPRRRAPPRIEWNVSPIRAPMKGRDPA